MRASSWTSLAVQATVVISIFGIALVEAVLRDVNLIIEPPAVRRGQHAIIRCVYNLNGSSLYSAKFYRGQLEFYRYMPSEFPNTKVFPFPGIHVDVTSSNATQVLIRNVGFGLTGNFSCEVSAEKPYFSTATAFGLMQVVELPDKRPQLYTDYLRYGPGDILRANCSSQPSRPRTELKFTINSIPVSSTDIQYIRTIDSLIVSRISLKIQLQPLHFTSISANMHAHGSGSNSGHMTNSVLALSGGSLKLRCNGQISDFYSQYKEIELGAPQKDPIPERVTLTAGTSMKKFFSSYFTSNGNELCPASAINFVAAVVVAKFSLQIAQFC